MNRRNFLRLVALAPVAGPVAVKAATAAKPAEQAGTITSGTAHHSTITLSQAVPEIDDALRPMIEAAQRTREMPPFLWPRTSTYSTAATLEAEAGWAFRESAYRLLIEDPLG